MSNTEQTSGIESRLQVPLPTPRLRLRKLRSATHCRTPLVSSVPGWDPDYFALEQLHVMPSGDTLWLELDVEVSDD